MIPQLHELALVGDAPESDLRLHSRTLMVALSHLIEDHAAEHPDTVLIATFQRFSLLRAEEARYAQIAQRLAQVYVVGVPDVPPPELPGATPIAIEPGWPLAQEWCVIGSGPRFSAALLARDAEGFRLERRSRQFRARWTTEPREVARLTTAFLQALGRDAPPPTHDTRATYASARALQAALARIYRQ